MFKALKMGYKPPELHGVGDGEEMGSPPASSVVSWGALQVPTTLG